MTAAIAAYLNFVISIMAGTTVLLWKKAPVLRLLLPLMAGILIQWYIPVAVFHLTIAACVCFVIVGVYSLLRLPQKFKFAVVNGTSISLLLVITGALLVYINNIQNDKNWIGSKSYEAVIVTLQEPLIEKPNSYKAIASINNIYDKGKMENAKGNIIIYFKKDSSAKSLDYGSQLIFNQPLQLIKNSGNPGSFNYSQYALFQGITHQVYLTPGKFVVLPGKHTTIKNTIVYKIRNIIIAIIRTYLPAKEEGLAEALLIGYKDDLDKNLVQAYTNTGVVHIIAISGLHLGLIYWLMAVVTKPLKRIKKLNWLRVVTIITALWLFSLLAGAQPSVLRSAVMFTFIAVAEIVDRRTSVYNTLALSAFLLLCYNPFWLWDVGFQLSYLAVLSIIIFFRPVYNWFYFTNKAVDFIWKLNAVTIAAQVLTLPVSLYHFHQFPNLFLLTNMVAVPLSSIILMTEILLCAVAWFPFIAQPIGVVIAFLIKTMNGYINQLDAISFSTWNGIQTSVVQTILLYIAVAGISYWLLEQYKKAFFLALFSLVAFVTLRTLSFIKADRQQKLIVYNVPKHKAVDIIQGRTYNFIGDSLLLKDDFARNFYLQPSRVLHRITPNTEAISTDNMVVNNKVIAFVNNTIYLKSGTPKKAIDILILSNNPKLYINAITKAFTVHQIVIDASVPAWKAALWMQDCDSLHIPCYNVAQKGAFVMNL